ELRAIFVLADSNPGLRSLALTTNAVLLKRKLPQLEGIIDSLNISLDTFHPERFRQLTQRDCFDDVIDGIEAALDNGMIKVKLNMVVLKGFNDDELLDFVRYTAERPVSVRFIEFMPFAGNHWTPEHCMTMAEMLEIIEREFILERIPDDFSPISR